VRFSCTSLGSLINENNGIEKLTLVPRGNTQGTTWTTPSLSQYNSRRVFLTSFNRNCWSCCRRNCKWYWRMYSWSSTRYCSDDTCCSYHGFTLCNGKITKLKQQAQQRNLFFLGSDVKQELNNIIDNFTTNFMDITYNEVVAFLEIVRPGGERLVDQLMISEELSGKIYVQLLVNIFQT
jgi:ATP-dependent Zn protease